MKKQERKFHNKEKWRRKDQFEKKLTQFEKWWKIKPIKYDWKDIRSKDRENFTKIMKGYDSDDLIWINKFQYFVDYF